MFSLESKSWRQYRKYLETKRPNNLADIVSEEDFAKAQLYGVDKSRFDFVATAYNQIQTVAMIVYDWLPLLWDYSGSLMYKFGGLGPEYEVRRAPYFIFGNQRSLRTNITNCLDFTIVGFLCHLCYHLHGVVTTSVTLLYLCSGGAPRI